MMSLGSRGPVSPKTVRIAGEPGMTEPLGFAIPVAVPFEEAYTITADALKREGFGVLTSIDIQSAFREKLGIEFQKYAILGVCNPALAYQALSADAEAGLLLPCTVTVEETGPQTSMIRIGNPAAMLRSGNFAETAMVRTVATEARARLGRVAAGLAKTRPA